MTDKQTDGKWMDGIDRWIDSIFGIKNKVHKDYRSSAL